MQVTDVLRKAVRGAAVRRAVKKDKDTVLLNG